MNRHDVRKNWDCIQLFGTGAEQVSGRGALKEQGQRQQVRVATGGRCFLKKGRSADEWSMAPVPKILNLSSIEPHLAPCHCPAGRQCGASGEGCGCYSLVRWRTA